MARIAWVAGAPVRAVLVAAILAYRGTVGVMLAGRCRFHPSCSAYALEAVRAHGAIRGGGLTLWRLLRCSPLTAGGLDPVPAGRSVKPSYSMTASYRRRKDR